MHASERGRRCGFDDGAFIERAKRKRPVSEPQISREIHIQLGSVNVPGMPCASRSWRFFLCLSSLTNSFRLFHSRSFSRSCALRAGFFLVVRAAADCGDPVVLPPSSVAATAEGDTVATARGSSYASFSPSAIAPSEVVGPGGDLRIAEGAS